MIRTATTVGLPTAADMALLHERAMRCGKTWRVDPSLTAPWVVDEDTGTVWVAGHLGMDELYRAVRDGLDELCHCARSRQGAPVIPLRIRGVGHRLGTG